MIRGQQSANDLRILSVELQHIYVLDELPLHHNDPLDRLPIAQAKAEQAWLVMVTADSSRILSMSSGRSG
jgi:PIN domain nuclease of toxin-antitoxin system